MLSQVVQFLSRSPVGPPSAMVTGSAQWMPSGERLTTIAAPTGSGSSTSARLEIIQTRWGSVVGDARVAHRVVGTADYLGRPGQEAAGEVVFPRRLAVSPSRY